MVHRPTRIRKEPGASTVSCQSDAVSASDPARPAVRPQLRNLAGLASLSISYTCRVVGQAILPAAANQWGRLIACPDCLLHKAPRTV